MYKKVLDNIDNGLTTLDAAGDGSNTGPSGSKEHHSQYDGAKYDPQLYAIPTDAARGGSNDGPGESDEHHSQYGGSASNPQPYAVPMAPFARTCTNVGGIDPDYIYVSNALMAHVGPDRKDAVNVASDPDYTALDAPTTYTGTESIVLDQFDPANGSAQSFQEKSHAQVHKGTAANTPNDKVHHASDKGECVFVAKPSVRLANTNNDDSGDDSGSPGSSASAKLVRQHSFC